MKADTKKAKIIAKEQAAKDFKCKACGKNTMKHCKEMCKSCYEKSYNKEKYEERLKKLEKDGHIIYTKKDIRKHIENLKKEILENNNKITNN